MYNFILQIILILSLGTMIYLIARTAPRISDDIIKQSKNKTNKFDRLIFFLRLEKLDLIFHDFLEKTLRKLKLFLMKLDNIAGNYLNKVKNYKSNSNGKNKKEKPTLFDSNTIDESENR